MFANLSNYISNDVVWNGDRQVVLGHLPHAFYLNERSGSSTLSKPLIVQPLIEPRAVSIFREINVTLCWDIGPASTSIKGCFSITFELVHGPAFGCVGAQKDGVFRVEPKIPLEISLRGHFVDVVQDVVYCFRIRIVLSKRG